MSAIEKEISSYLTDNLLALSASLKLISGNDKYKLVINKNTFEKICIEMGGLIQDENNNFIDSSKSLENINKAKLFMITIEKELL